MVYIFVENAELTPRRLTNRAYLKQWEKPVRFFRAVPGSPTGELTVRLRNYDMFSLRFLGGWREERTRF
jgi:hypothetical protein